MLTGTTKGSIITVSKERNLLMIKKTKKSNQTKKKKRRKQNGKKLDGVRSRRSITYGKQC